MYNLMIIDNNNEDIKIINCDKLSEVQEVLELEESECDFSEFISGNIEEIRYNNKSYRFVTLENFENYIEQYETT